MPEFYLILARKISKIPEFYYICPKNLQNSRFLHDFCPKNARILHKNCQTNFYRILGGHVPPLTPPSPTPMYPTFCFPCTDAFVDRERSPRTVPKNGPQWPPTLFLFLLLPDLRSAKAFSFHNRSSPNFS